MTAKTAKNTIKPPFFIALSSLLVDGFVIWNITRSNKSVNIAARIKMWQNYINIILIVYLILLPERSGAKSKADLIKTLRQAQGVSKWTTNSDTTGN